MSENGDLQYIAAIDTSAYDGALDHMVSSASEASSEIANESQKINDLLTNIPEVKIDFLQNISSVSEMEEGIGQAFAQIAGVIRENQTAIGELNRMYTEAVETANKFANSPVEHLRAEAQEARKQSKAILEVIKTRKQAIAAAKEEEKALEKETKSLIASAKAKSQNGSAAQSLKRQIRELEAEAALMVKTAQDEGRTLDQTKGRYREIIEELGRLRDIRGDISQAGNVFANDENQIAGVIQGLSGLSGAFSVAQGAVGLFGAENEKLNEIMLKVQSLMAITMGLQQVQQVLNKDSTFSLVTLNAVKKLFSKHTEEAAAVISDENAEIAENIQKTKEDIVQKEASETAEIADTDATLANTGATKGNATAQTQKATSEKAATASTNAHTGSMVGATVATKTLTAATKLLKIALISTGIGALVVLVGELVAMVVNLFSAEDEATKHTQDLQKVNEEAAETYIKEKIALEDNIRACKNFHGTKEQEKKKVDELNSKYGEALGYYDSLEQWERVLEERGPAYCEMLRMKAVQQGLLNKYVEAYVEALEVAHKAENGEFDRGWYNPARWFGDSNEERRANMKAEAQKEADYWKEAMEQQRADLEAYQKANHFDVVHIDPKAKKVSGGGKSGDTFDPKKAASEQKKLLEEYQKAVTQYVKDTNAAISQAAIDSMEDGYYKEINAMYKQMNDRKTAWQQQLMQLATTLRDSTKAYYLTQKGATEDGWNSSEQGKRSLTDWANELLKDPQIADNYSQGLLDIDNALQKGLSDIRDKYFKQLVNDFGTYNQKFDQLSIEWQKKIGFIGSAFPDFLPEALKQMEEEFSALKAEDFQKTINWDVVFGNLGEQSLQSLQFTLDKVRTYFNQEGKNMSVEQIKIFQEAIDKMEDEIASRNPFTAMHKSLADIGDAKTELVAALGELATAQNELTAAQNEYNAAFREENDLRAEVNSANRADEVDALMDAQRKAISTEEEYQQCLEARNEVLERISRGKLAADCEELTSATEALTDAETARNEAIQQRDTLMQNMNDAELANQCLTLVDAQERLSKSETTLTAAREKNTKAEQRTLTARNKVTKSYKTFATNLNSAGKVATDVGKKASNLARVFSDDIADGMEKALDCIDEVLDATTDVISAIGDVGKSVGKGMTETVDAMGTATESTAQATATSISTVEKASVILTVISAALQIATAIANLFNNDDKKQKEIERLQERIDQLQWELDNQDAVRLQKNVGNALEQVKKIYAEARQEVLKLHGVMQNATAWQKWIAGCVYQSEIYAKTVEKIADYWAKASYTADKALGSKRYDESRKQLENLAEQQLLVQKQLNEEESKKHTDSGKVQDYKNKLAELAEEMATLINDMLEDIIGASAEDIAQQLGDAFFEAVKSGEDAMEAWRNKVNEIVSDILRRMMIQKLLEEPIGQIFDKYKQRWFGTDGRFKGIDSVIGSMDEFSNDLNAVGSSFKAIMDELPDEIKQYFTGDEERQASERGIATASQDSVDENNARLTTIQSHTYTIVQGVAELNATGNQILDKLSGIEDNTAKTAETLDDVKEEVKRVKDAVEDITTKGIKLKS